MTLVAPAVVVLLAFQGHARLPRAVEAKALEEAAGIWAPYGVAIGRANPCVPQDGATRLTVTIAKPSGGSDAAGSWTGIFGAIQFSDGVPAPEITLFYDEMIRLMRTTPLRGKSEIDWPAAFRQLMLGRVVGRVLAHEIGHFLLRLRGHASSGLMRSQPSLADMIDVDRRRFVLSPADQANWQLLRNGAAVGWVW
jgi:hypothetical protein